MDNNNRQVINLRNRETSGDGSTIEVVGVSIGFSGRSCAEHAICGMRIQAGWILIFRKSITIIHGVRDDCVKVYTYHNRTQGCHVGFLPRYMRSTWPLFVDKKGIVVKDLRSSDNRMEQNRSASMGGIVMVSVSDHLN